MAFETEGYAGGGCLKTSEIPSVSIHNAVISIGHNNDHIPTLAELFAGILGEFPRALVVPRVEFDRASLTLVIPASFQNSFIDFSNKVLFG